MLHDGLQKLATAGAESVSILMIMTICVGASPPPIELARAAACPARFSRGGSGRSFSGSPSAFVEPDETHQRFSHFTALFVGVGRVFSAFFLALSFDPPGVWLRRPVDPGRAARGARIALRIKS